MMGINGSLRTPSSRRLSPIVFSTTSAAKFLQAKLLFSRQGLRVDRLIAHGRPYPEPYGLPEEEFLAVGLNDAISRAGSNRILFIEDTTVELTAFSNGDKKVPGQMTKEWFAATSHSDLVKELDRLDDDRAIVRSSVALHIPGLRRILYFRGETRGRVSGTESEVKPNKLYPWLGRNDFSAWFVPDGSTKCLANMSCEESLRYDFRAQAFEQLILRLLEYESVVNLPSTSISLMPERTASDQLALAPWPGSNICIAVAGAIGSGKTTLGHLLAMKWGFQHVEGSEAIRKVAEQNGIDDLSGFELADKVFARKGPQAVERDYLWPLIENATGPLVYTGARTLEGLEYLHSMTQSAGVRLVIVSVSCPDIVRRSRLAERARTPSGPAIPYDDASKRDIAYGASQYARYLCDHRLHNHGSVDVFIKQIDRELILGEVCAKTGGSTRDRRRWLQALSSTRGIQGLAARCPDLVELSPLAQTYQLSSRGHALLTLLRRNMREEVSV